MSSYWMGYHATGLFMTEEEYEGFKEAYLQQHPLESHSDSQDALENYWDEDIREDFLYKSSDKSLPEFYLIHIDEETSDGACLWTFERGEEVFSRRHGWILPVLKPLDGRKALVKKPYKDYGELKAELMARISSYLPEDFPWDDRIGVIDYAVYA